MEQILREAATYEGGLDRGNIAVAARQINTANPLLFDGITQQTSGFADAYLIEGGRMEQYTVERSEPPSARWVPAGDLLDNNGGIGNYEDFLRRRADGSGRCLAGRRAPCAR